MLDCWSIWRMTPASRLSSPCVALKRSHLRGNSRPMAISLDVFLPDMLGWAVLSQLKQDPRTRHIPVQIMTLDEDWHHGLASGAFSFTNKPTTMEGLKQSIERLTDYAEPRRKRLLVVEDNAAERLGITELLGDEDIEVVTAASGGEALETLACSRRIASCWICAFPI